MATVAVYNGFGQYEKRGRELGITLTYAGVEFWFPYKQVTYIPDWTFREVDHKETAGQDGDTEAFLTYKTWSCKGERVVEELLDKQEPIPNGKKGIIRLANPAPKGGNPISVFCGIEENGDIVTADIFEVVPSEADVTTAERMAYNYKEQIIQEYFASKRERLSGGHGQLVPRGFVKKFMEELNVKDIDALPSQQSNSKLEALLTQFLTAIASMGGVKPALETTAPQPPVSTPGAKAKVKAGDDVKDLV
jgi:hypothetical protein